MYFQSRRSIVYGSHCLVASSQPLACEAGLEILRLGGNAADAAVATAIALNVCEPCSCGIGGDSFLLFYNNKTKEVLSLNGSGRSPIKLNLKEIRQMGIEGDHIPLRNCNSITVPGAVDAFLDTIQLFGSGNVSLKEIFTPGIRLAEEGYPVSEITAYHWLAGEELLLQASKNANDMLRNGKAPKAGEIMKMPKLAQVFREIVQKGREGFYDGYVAKEIVQIISEKGGLMTLDDLLKHQSTIVQPISISYPLNSTERIQIWECPPNGQGIIALMAIGILEEMKKLDLISNLNEYKHNSAEYLHILIESLRLAFADGNHFISDSNFNDIPIKELLSSDYLSKRAQTFNSQSINKELVHGNPLNSCDTVYLAVTDDQGNACSLIFSNYSGFGTGIIPSNCGFTLQNRGSNFLLKENHRNSLEGGKRPYHTIIPSMITKENGDFLACYGVMGGFMQPQGHLQVLINLLRSNFHIQNALDLPRFCIIPSNSNQEQNLSEVYLEDGIEEDVLEKLRSYGHHVTLIKDHQRSIFGRGQIILKVNNDENHLVWAGASDPRADGHATGF